MLNDRPLWVSLEWLTNSDTRQLAIKENVQKYVIWPLIHDLSHSTALRWKRSKYGIFHKIGWLYGGRVNHQAKRQHITSLHCKVMAKTPKIKLMKHQTWHSCATDNTREVTITGVLTEWSKCKKEFLKKWGVEVYGETTCANNAQSSSQVKLWARGQTWALPNAVSQDAQATTSVTNTTVPGCSICLCIWTPCNVLRRWHNVVRSYSNEHHNPRTRYFWLKVIWAHLEET